MAICKCYRRVKICSIGLLEKLIKKLKNKTASKEILWKNSSEHNTILDTWRKHTKTLIVKIVNI